VNDLFEEPDGATPLDLDDRAGLRRTDIALRAELNEAEAENILAAQVWAVGARRSLAGWLTQPRMRELHRRMFGEVWSWAGTLRLREASIGIDPYRITTELENLLLDVKAQTADRQSLAWPADEVAVRFHHRLVSIHPFPNGNGRHARLAEDIVVRSLGQPRFTWGHAGYLTDASDARARYLAGLRLADRDGEYGALLQFARS
jgi:Fic-DOC domain mobile mystery protein B